ncbi:hypothetical protein K8I61_12715 [bacterium]|nr:hypothetical protein [bacterium]
MIDQNVLARLHLSAVLQNLEDVVAFDDEARDIIRGWNEVLQFSCPGGIAAHLEIGDGRVRWHAGRTKRPTVHLHFLSAEHLNRTFAGTGGFSMPIPLRGLTRLKVLKGFDKLAKRMEHYLKPTPEMLKDRKVFEFHVGLLLNTVTFGLSPVAEHDEKARLAAASIRDGIGLIHIPNGPAAHVVIKGGRLFPQKGIVENPSMIMEIADHDTAFELFGGEGDAMALVGSCRLKIKGFVPIADKLNAALDRLPVYLS